MRIHPVQWPWSPGDQPEGDALQPSSLSGLSCLRGFMDQDGTCLWVRSLEQG